MNIVPQTKSLAQRHAADVASGDHFVSGYALYMGGQPLSTCQNNDQRRGYHNAQIAEMAAADCDTSAYLVRNGSRAQP